MTDTEGGPGVTNDLAIMRQLPPEYWDAAERARVSVTPDPSMSLRRYYRELNWAGFRELVLLKPQPAVDHADWEQTG